MKFSLRTCVALGGLGVLMSCALSAPLRERVAQDWNLAESIRGPDATALHRQIFGGTALDGRVYRRFFESRVNSLSGEGIGFASCHGATACSTGDGTVRLTSRFGEPGLPEIVALSLLLHEARHAEGYSHVPCETPSLVSPYERAPLIHLEECDSNERGPLGVQIVMLANVARYCATCDSGLRQAARNYAQALIPLVAAASAQAVLRAELAPAAHLK